MTESHDPPQNTAWTVREKVAASAGMQKPQAQAKNLSRVSTDKPQSIGSGAEMSSIAVTFSGVFGGVYLLYAIGWIAIVNSYAQLNALTSQTGGVVGSFLQNIVFFFAILAAPLWFICTFMFWAKKSSKKLFAALLLGALLLAPLPLFVTGAGI